MPIYEYICDACNLRTEKLVGLDDGTKPSCQKCGKEMKKTWSVPAIQFVGGGWAKDGYSKKAVKDE